MLGMELAHQERRGRGVGELGEHDGQAPLAKRGDQLLDARHDVAHGRDLHGLARLHEGALHVDDEERGAPGVQGQRPRERLVAVHPDYQADTENAFGMWRIALTAPSSLKITETTSNRQETCRSRLSLR